MSSLKFRKSSFLVVVAVVAGITFHLQAAESSVTVVEYRNTALDAYFITGRPGEQALLDANASFVRTGMSFSATPISAASSALGRVCRFYIGITSPYVSSHFYGTQAATNQPYDCEGLRANLPSGFSDEGYDFAVQLPANGTCPSGSTVVYRGFRPLAVPSNGKTSNHRYSVSSGSYASAAALGYGGEGVQFCVSSSTDIAPMPSSQIDPTKIPVGDGKLSTTTPQVGYVYSCTIPNSPNAPTRSFWISADGKTWNSTTKITVQGAVQWMSQFAAQLNSNGRNISGNGLPSHLTGTFPIAPSDPARAFDGNPNAIQAVAIAWGLPSNPTIAAQPTCTGLGAVGVLLTGGRVFNALDADGLDASAHEVQDSCDGHPQGAGLYHYHSLSRCAQTTDDPNSHSPLVGYIADGFGLYGNRGERGKALTNADLDECHGHSHSIIIDGVATVQYHYHATREYPYTIGCFKGTPVRIR